MFQVHGCVHRRPGAPPAPLKPYVFPGDSFSQKMSSLVLPYSTAPSIYPGKRVNVRPGCPQRGCPVCRHRISQPMWLCLLLQAPPHVWMGTTHFRLSEVAGGREVARGSLSHAPGTPNSRPRLWGGRGAERQAGSEDTRLKADVTDQAPSWDSSWALCQEGSRLPRTPGGPGERPHSRWGIQKECLRGRCAGREETDLKQFMISTGKKNKAKNFSSLLKEDQKVRYRREKNSKVLDAAGQVAERRLAPGQPPWPRGSCFIPLWVSGGRWGQARPSHAPWPATCGAELVTGPQEPVWPSGALTGTSMGPAVGEGSQMVCCISLHKSVFPPTEPPRLPEGHLAQLPGTLWWLFSLGQQPRW